MTVPVLSELNLSVSLCVQDTEEEEDDDDEDEDDDEQEKASSEADSSSEDDDDDDDDDEVCSLSQLSDCMAPYSHSMKMLDFSDYWAKGLKIWIEEGGTHL